MKTITFPISKEEATGLVRDFFVHGLLTDVIKAEQAISIYKRIADHHGSLISGNKYQLDLFSTLQRYSFDQTILSLGRLYDSNTWQATRSAVNLLGKLNEYAPYLPEIIEDHLTTQLLRKQGFQEDVICLVTNENSSLFPMAISSHYTRMLAKPELLESVSRLKYIRDKQLAHNDQDAEIKGIGWDKLDMLFKFIKDVIDIIGQAYYGSSYRISADAESSSFFVEEIIRQLRTISDDVLHA